MLPPQPRAGDEGQRRDRERLREGVRQVAGSHDPESDRDQVIERDGDCAGHAVAANPPRHAIDEQSRQHIAGADDRAQQRHVRRAAPDEPGKRQRRDVQTRRVREPVVARRQRGEIPAPGDDILKTVRLEERVADRHVGMQQDQELREKRRGRKRDRKARGVAKRGAANRGRRPREGDDGDRRPDRHPRGDPGVVRVRTGSVRDDGTDGCAEQNRAADRGSGGDAEQRDRDAHGRRRDRDALERRSRWQHDPGWFDRDGIDHEAERSAIAGTRHEGVRRPHLDRQSRRRGLRRNRQPHGLVGGAGLIGVDRRAVHHDGRADAVDEELDDGVRGCRRPAPPASGCRAPTPPAGRRRRARGTASVTPMRT